ncbi:hypothetical protein Agub_g6468 [Astrephomene gubernaculifera]|uniref:Uncharacterized protein n=1 Tax=Astrephomene gubernaculifera TaxID=47775 RepID=A0AAD3DQI1_9CHLO|nr:hypothetical protein Agub_g6468 [Astrephomene gubernaculifera]
MSESVLSDYGSEDIAQTVAILTQLKSENVDLKRNFENLKGLHVRLNETYKGLQNRYTALYDERTNVEKQYQSLCESWRVELEEKQRQLEAAKAQILGPRDMDVLRVKLLEELEAPYRAKCDNLTKEAESSHQAYLKLRREYEELQNTYRSLEVRTVGEQEAHRLEHTALVRELRDKTGQITQLQGKLTSCESAVRSLQREVEAARYSGAQMKQELEEVRRAKEKAVVEREAAAVQADKKVKAAEEEAAQLMSYVESVSRKNRHLVQELAESQRAAEDLFAANVRLQSSQTQLQSQLDSCVRLSAAEKAALVAEQEEAVRRLEERLAAAAGEAAKRESAAAEAKLAMQEELSKQHSVWESKLSEERRAAAERLREVMDGKADAAERAAAQLRAVEERCREGEAALRAAQSEAEAHAREAAAEGQRAEGLAKQLAEASAAGEAARGELAEIKSELLRCQLQCQQLSERRAELEQRLRAAEEATVQVRAARDALAAELEAARREAEEERSGAARAAEASRSAWAIEKAAIAKRYQSAMKEQAARHEAELRKLKRKARGAHAAVAALTDEVADLKFKAAEAKHVNHMSEILYLNTGGSTGARATSPYRDMPPSSALPYSSAGGAFGYGYLGSGGGARPTTAPSYMQPAAAATTLTGGGAAASAMGALRPHRSTAGAEGQGTEGGGGGGAVGASSGGSGAAAVGADLLGSMAALKQRQQEYMDAAKLGVQP